ncbi:T9SS C-terminal target domain-containing protein [candidate division KSB1 bacterium]|nr:T9SS type A sorting domain-containing protein [candidate division KSB1 bacterium]RQW03195.1 MAG: T9SS C-terminal target domain-containing protein [candidate division KSB1 bacterium]
MPINFDKICFHLAGILIIFLFIHNTDAREKTIEVRIDSQGKLYSPAASTLLISFPTPGWYLISLPLQVQDNSVSTLFPMSKGTFTWQDNSYVQESNIEIGQGYWLLVNQPSVATIQGEPALQFSRSLDKGWHLIGSLVDTVDFSDPQDTPNQSVSVPLFLWHGGEHSGYEATTTLVQAFGYWIKVLRDCELIVSRTGVKQASPENHPQLSHDQTRDHHSFSDVMIKTDTNSAYAWIVPLKITFENHEYYLECGEHEGATSDFDPNIDRPTPPAPPRQDVPYCYFSIEHFPHALKSDFRNPGASHRWSLSIASATDKTYSVSWHITHPPDGALVLNDTLDMRKITSAVFSGNHTLTISFMPTAVQKQRDIDLPSSFTLTVYPNPFEKSTTLLINSPPSQNMRLAIYNVLGQHIKNLTVPSNPQLGVTWDGTDKNGLTVPIGLYFVISDDEKSRSITKMIKTR